MKFTIIATLAAVAAAQSIADLPSCATSCAVSSIGVSDCAITDTACLCADEAFSEAIATCITDECSEADQASALEILTGTCDAPSDDDVEEDVVEEDVADTTTVAAPTATETIPTTAVVSTTTAAVGTGGAYTPTNATTDYAPTPTRFAGGAEALKAGQWMGFAALFALVAL